MGFFTQLQVQSTDFEDINLSTRQTEILAILSADGIHEDVLIDLQQAFNEGKADLNLDAVYCLELLEKIIPLFPQANFECRGLGEEFMFTWILCIEDGNVTFKSIPWEAEEAF